MLTNQRAQDTDRLPGHLGEELGEGVQEMVRSSGNAI